VAGDSFKRINWTTGMLLTPDHFRRTDAYVGDVFEWLLRRTVSTTGLLGAGPRSARSERGLERDDPKLDIWDDGKTVRVSVQQARGISAAGGFFEIESPRVVRREYNKSDLAGNTEFVVYLVPTGSVEEDETSAGADPANPNQRAWVREGYTIELGIRADQVSDALAVGRIKRASETQTFELDGQFIPACASMLGHSALFAGWRRLQTELRSLAAAFGELHRLIAKYVEEISRRGLDSRADQSVSSFVERAVLALDGCVYATMDSALSPAETFQQIDRAGRQIALALDLSSATREYLTMLSSAEASYSGLLEEERNALSTDREISMRDNVRVDLERAEQTLARVRALVHAIEGKYIDYRINRSVDALRFLIDRGGEQFYTVVASPGHAQRDGDLLTFVFSQLNLPGRHEYRVLILGDPNGVSKWEVGDELRPALRINAASGAGKPISPTLPCEMPGQRNFALNFDSPPDIPTITSLHLSIQPAHKVRGAVLYQRRRGLVPETIGSVAPAPVEREQAAVRINTPLPNASQSTTGGGPKITFKKK
jgi:hypothetical protein